MSKKLWLVEIDDDDWDYDRFESAVVWAADAAEAERIVRSEKMPKLLGLEELLIESPEWRLSAKPAPTEGIALMHWHAG